MKFWNKSKLFIVLIIALVGCNDFEDMNVDPNNPSQALPDLLLSASLVSVSGVIGATTPAMYVQYFALVFISSLNFLPLHLDPSCHISK